jgi:hypothetical protein
MIVIYQMRIVRALRLIAPLISGWKESCRAKEFVLNELLIEAAEEWGVDASCISPPPWNQQRKPKRKKRKRKRKITITITITSNHNAKHTRTTY